MENLELIAKLTTKVEELANKIGTMGKDGTNDFSHYSFVSHEAMTKRISELLLENKLSIRPSVVAYEEREYTSGQKTGVRSIVTMNFKITDTETGYTEIESFVGAENDTGGKSMQQAITQATKYFYFKFFKVPFGDDGDSKTAGSETSKKTKNDTPQFWFDERNKIHVAGIRAKRKEKMTGKEIIAELRDKNIGVSKKNAEDILSGKIGADDSEKKEKLPY